MRYDVSVATSGVRVVARHTCETQLGTANGAPHLLHCRLTIHQAADSAEGLCTAGPTEQLIVAEA